MDKDTDEKLIEAVATALRNKLRDTPVFQSICSDGNCSPHGVAELLSDGLARTALAAVRQAEGVAKNIRKYGPEPTASAALARIEAEGE